MKTLKLGIAGAGFAARFHLENLPEAGVGVVGVTSARAESRDAFAAKHKLRAFASVEEMLPEIDVLDICTPPSSHQPYILAAARAGKHVIVEKPLTGFYGSPEKTSKREMLDAVVESGRELLEAVRGAGITLGYAENFVYAPSVQKEREIIERTRAQVLRMQGEESHNGSHSPVYGIWSVQGGGSLIAKGCHPLGAILYLNRDGACAKCVRTSCCTPLLACKSEKWKQCVLGGKVPSDPCPPEEIEKGCRSLALCALEYQCNAVCYNK